jgi:hypothetical protein
MLVFFLHQQIFDFTSQNMKYSLILLTVACFLLQFMFVTAAVERRDEQPTETTDPNDPAEPTDANKQGGGGYGDGRRRPGRCSNGRRYGDRWYRGCNTCWCDRQGIHCTHRRCRAEDN